VEWTALYALASLGPTSLAAVLELLESGDEALVADATFILSVMSQDKLAAALAGYLEGEDPELRRRAARALALAPIAAMEVVPSLQRAASAADPALRRAAAVALREAGHAP
jgi:HEAT repeat protein